MIDEERKDPKTPEDGLGFSETTRNLLRLKDTSELMVDLSYSALLYDNEDIANEIIYLEEVADSLEREVMLSALNQGIQDNDPHRSYVMIRLANAMEMIADAAVSMADVVLRDIEKNPVISLSLRDSKTTITSVMVARSSRLDGRTLGEVRLASESGMWVIAIRRNKSYIYGPDENTVVMAGDMLIARGPKKGRAALLKLAGSEPKGEDDEEEEEYE